MKETIAALIILVAGLLVILVFNEGGGIPIPKKTKLDLTCDRLPVQGADCVVCDYTHGSRGLAMSCFRNLPMEETDAKAGN